MTLMEQLEKVKAGTRIRIFVGCHTIFNGWRHLCHEREWNMMLYHYANCDVIGIITNICSTEIFI